MENPKQVNRVESALNKWRDIEDHWNKDHNINLSSNKGLLHAKLRNYDKVSAKYRNSENESERMAVRILRQERRKLERQLYPYLLIRLFRRLMILPIVSMLLQRREQQQTQINSQSLNDQLQRAGFGAQREMISEKLNKGEQQFSVPASQYMNRSERMDFELAITVGDSGDAKLTGFKAALIDEKNGTSRSHFFSTDAGRQIDLNQAFNLLAGRAVHTGDRWLQLDLNDRSPEGNYRMKEFPESYDYNLKTTIREMGLENITDNSQLQALVKQLEKGDQAQVSFANNERNERFTIEANPHFRSVNVFDERGKKVSLAAASGKKTLVDHKVTAAKNEKSNQSTRSKMRVVN